MFLQFHSKDAIFYLPQYCSHKADTVSDLLWETEVKLSRKMAYRNPKVIFHPYFFFMSKSGRNKFLCATSNVKLSR